VRFEKELPALPLFYPVYRYAVDAQVQGVRMGPLFDPSDRFNTVTSWYLVTKRSDGATDEPVSATDTPAP
jgi:peptide/nickel transport system substrate-binding protein